MASYILLHKRSIYIICRYKEPVIYLFEIQRLCISRPNVIKRTGMGNPNLLGLALASSKIASQLK